MKSRWQVCARGCGSWNSLCQIISILGACHALMCRLDAFKKSVWAVSTVIKEGRDEERSEAVQDISYRMPVNREALRPEALIKG